MKPQFFDIDDLKSKPLSVWSNQLEHCSDGFSGNIYFVDSAGSKFRVSFDFLCGAYSAKFFSFRSRIPFNVKYALSLTELFDEVYRLLND